MIPLLSRDAVRALDRDAVDRLGLPSLALMENAGRGAFEAMCERFEPALVHVLIIAGPGQNGGDGFVIARHLVAAGHTPRVVLTAEPNTLQGDAAQNFGVLMALGVVLIDISGAGHDGIVTLEEELAAATLIVDGLFGTGLDRPVIGWHADVIEALNASGKPIVSLDIPSGVDANTGAVLGVACRAQLTVTFAAHKRGLHQHPGATLAGELVCVSIGVPIGERVQEASAALLQARDIADIVAPRALDAHKGSAGHVLVIAGAPGRTGAALLSGLGALRMGAGLATLATQEAARVALDHKVIELMTETLPSDPMQAAQRARELAQGKSSAVIGPGLGVDGYARALAKVLAVELELPAVLDADALTALGSDCAMLLRARAPRVLTPHPGEASRLLDISTEDVQRDRFAAAETLAARTGAVVVLKGSRTIIASPKHPPRVCPTGAPAMAVAGTGDVLAGALGALLARNAPFEAACAAAYLHGVAGELASTGDRGLLASELAAQLPAALVAVR